MSYYTCETTNSLFATMELAKFINKNKDMYTALKLEEEPNIESAASKILAVKLKEIIKNNDFKASVKNFQSNIIIEIKGDKIDALTCLYFLALDWHFAKREASSFPYLSQYLPLDKFYENDKTKDLMKTVTGFPVFITIDGPDGNLINLTSIAKLSTFTQYDLKNILNTVRYSSHNEFVIKLRLSKFYLPKKNYESIGGDYHDRILAFMQYYNEYKKTLELTYSTLAIFEKFLSKFRPTRSSVRQGIENMFLLNIYCKNADLPIFNFLSEILWRNIFDQNVKIIEHNDSLETIKNKITTFFDKEIVNMLSTNISHQELNTFLQSIIDEL